MKHFKHLSLEERITIQTLLDQGSSFRFIASSLQRDTKTISNEIKSNGETILSGARGRTRNRCTKRYVCTLSYICSSGSCTRELCRYCSQCNASCIHYIEDICSLLSKAPYSCNSCETKLKCVLRKKFYHASYAQNTYELRRSESRSGLTVSEDELQQLDHLITPFVLLKQSLHHICVANADKLTYSERSLYRFVNQGLLSVRNIDLPRQVRYSARKKSIPYKVDKKCKLNRTFLDFKRYMEDNPDTAVVEMDSVIGRVGGKVLLTIFFKNSNLMLAFLRDSNHSQSVLDIIDELYQRLGKTNFRQLFPVLLGDNGSEFSNPLAIECDSENHQRTRVFYCDPGRPDQKGGIEKNHEEIRMILPKGYSFDHLVQSDIDLMMNHINSKIRKKLNDRTPRQTFNFIYGEEILHALGVQEIALSEVNLTTNLLPKAPKE